MINLNEFINAETVTGIAAMCFGTGAVFGYGFFKKTTGKYLEDQIQELKKEIKNERDKCDEKLDKLDQRIIALEKSRLEIAIDNNKPPG